MPIHILETNDQLDRLLNGVSPAKALIFKHSTRCSISRIVWDRLQRTWDIDEARVPFYYLDLLKHRELSNRIATDLNVQHESPQALLIENGHCIWHASHTEINISSIHEALEGH